MSVLSLLLFWQVRREKISERMKFLQDLVPGCNKVLKKCAIFGLKIVELV